MKHTILITNQEFHSALEETGEFLKQWYIESVKDGMTEIDWFKLALEIWCSAYFHLDNNLSHSPKTIRNIKTQIFVSTYLDGIEPKSSRYYLKELLDAHYRQSSSPL